MKIERILICVIMPGFNLTNRYSAVASVIYSFADVLRKNGYDVYVNDLKLTDWENKSTENTSNYQSALVKSKFHKFFPARFRELIKDLLALKYNNALIKSIDKIPKPDLIISWISYASSHAIDLSKKWQVPVVSIFDNPLSEEYTYLKGFKPFIKNYVDRQEKISVIHSDALIVYSHAVKNHLQKKYGAKGAFYFKAFTDFKRMHYQNLDKDLSVINFSYIGSFFNWHKIDDLIFAFDKLSMKYSNCKLYLIGDGPEYNRIKEAVKNPAIIFTGRMDGSGLEQLMQKIHVGIISNALWFQAPVKLFQYSAAQLAVISRKTPTILELTNNKEYYSFFETEDDLENKMIALMESPNLIKERGIQSQKYIKENFSEENYLQLFREIFNNIKFRQI